MRPFTSTIPLDEARRRLSASVRPMARVEGIGLADAAGRVAAAAVTSPIDVPPFVRSAMDGYAVIAADTARASDHSPVRLRLVDRIYTGNVSRAVVTSGTCAEIATGAPVPAGADAVVMVEETRLEGRPGGGRPGDAGQDPGGASRPPETVAILHAASPGQNVGRRGADIASGATIVSPGDVLTPGRIGSLAAIGCTGVDVFERPRVAVLSTGNEVVEPGRALAPGQIYDVNRFTLSAVIAAHGGVPVAHHVVQDSLEALLAALDACGPADLLVFSGGSSVGERDLMLDLVAARGEMIFHGISIKPGKPTAFALVDGRPLFGMPGNPTSCLSNAYILLVPYLRATARLPPFRPHTLRAPLGRRIESAAKRHQIYTVRLLDGVAYPAFKGSGDITSLSLADGYIQIAEGVDVVEQGSEVMVTLF